MATSTRTVVFTDLANYTQSVGRSDRAALRNLISVHEKFVVPILERHHGRVVKNLGDSFMALFPSATDALRAGLEVVEEGLKSGGFLLRVSCATGDVEEIDGDAFGDAVNLSARINSQTPAGEIWFSESTRQCMNQSEIPWEAVGSFTLKGIAGDMSCYRAVTSGGCQLPAPIETAIKAGNLVRIKNGQPTPPLPVDPPFSSRVSSSDSPSSHAWSRVSPCWTPPGSGCPPTSSRQLTGTAGSAPDVAWSSPKTTP